MKLSKRERWIRCERQEDGITARVVGYTPGQVQVDHVYGYIKMLNERYYPYPLASNGVRLQPTHYYQSQSHAMTHLLTGEPGEWAIAITHPETYGINVPKTQALPPEAIERSDPWEVAA